MYTVTNTNGQLKLTYSNLVEYYEFQTFKSISFAFDTVKGKYYVSINFIANDKNNSLRLYLVDISNQPTWTDTTTGAAQAVNDISSWISNAVVISSSGIQKKSQSIRVTTSSSIIEKVNSISFANVGTANATISSDANFSSITVKPGETISFDAGDINNFFAASNFYYNATTAGAELLIAYTY
jgi:hypothetical protein